MQPSRPSRRPPGDARAEFCSIRRVISAIAFALLCSVVPTKAAESGAIRGSVYDRDFGVPIPRARVGVLELPLSAATGADGAFLIEAVPAGIYTLVVSKEGYEREIISDVTVAGGRMAEVRVELGSEVIEMEELVVTGVDLLGNSEIGILDVRATAVTMQDGISAELISRAGASDVAGALKLVVGASVTEGKYATVRGLSDRYTGTTLNGVRVPSADPRRRAVQVDLFPTGTIDAVSVSKTFTPNLQGDFTGGGVDIRTRAIPDGPVLSFSVSSELNSQATDAERFISYQGGGVSGLGFNAGGGLVPAGAREALPPLSTSLSPNPNATQIATAEAYDRFTRSFTPVIGVSSGEADPNTGFSLVAGNSFALGTDDLFGVLAAVTWSHKYDFYENAVNNTGEVSTPDAPIAITRPRRDTRGTEEITFGALASLVMQPNPNTEIALRFVLNQSAEDEARLQRQTTGPSSEEQNQSLHYTERTVRAIQLHGEHGAGTSGEEAATVRWFLASNRTRQDEPDVRFFRNTYNRDTRSGGFPSGSTFAQNTRRIFREIGEGNLQGGLDATVPFTRWGSHRGDLRYGLLLDWTDRGYQQRSFSYRYFVPQLGSTSNPAVAFNRSVATFQADHEGQLWTDVFLDADRIGLAPQRCPPGMPAATCSLPTQLLWFIVPTGADVDYDGEQDIEALYAMVDLPLHPRVKLVGGARYETTELSVVPVNPAFGQVEVINLLPSGDRELVRVDQDEATVAIDDEALLPSVGLVWEPRPAMNVRATWSRTLARPTFRELAPVATEEFLFGDEFLGNPTLRLSRIQNYDLRWEWFRRAGEVLAASVFYKSITDPIEQISFAAGGRFFVQPINYERGDVRGFELEARSELDVFADALRGLAATVNYTWIESQVEVPLAERISLSDYSLDQRQRRLQGQPDAIINASLVYENDFYGTSAGLFYNRVGETLLTGAARGLNGGIPNVIELPTSSLDLTVSQKLWEHFSVGFKVRNLLRADRRSVYRTPGGDEAPRVQRETARTIGLSATARW